jgi:hypothetical protein
MFQPIVASSGTMRKSIVAICSSIVPNVVEWENMSFFLVQKKIWVIRECGVFIWQYVQFQHTKHIEMNIHFVWEKVACGHVRVLHFPSLYQIVDIFPKDFRCNFLMILGIGSTTLTSSRMN